PCTHVILYFFFQAEDGIRDRNVTGVQTCALPISLRAVANPPGPGSAEPWVPWPAGVTPRAWPTAWSGRASKTKDWRSTSTTRRDEAPQRPNPGRAQGSAPCPASQGRLQPFGGVGIAQPQFVEEQRDECGQGSQDLVGGQVAYQAWFQGRCHIRGEQVGTFGVVGGQVQTKTGQGDDLRTQSTDPVLGLPQAPALDAHTCVAGVMPGKTDQKAGIGGGKGVEGLLLAVQKLPLCTLGAESGLGE